MKFKNFIYRKDKGNWFKKLWTYCYFSMPGKYLANIPSEVPFYRTVAQKTQCYLAESDVVLELRGDRWYALGDSPEAKFLNKEIEFYTQAAEQITEEEILLQIQKMTGNQDVADRIIQAELDRVGVVLAPYKES